MQQKISLIVTEVKISAITLKNLEQVLIVFPILDTKHQNKIPIVFHNGSIYDYYFIINKLAKDFDGQLECLGENTETYITFSVTIGK